jgi:uncharacterized membrane protein YkoI
MKRRLIFVFAPLFALSAAAAAAPHVSQADAKKIALARVPGTVVHEKLKHRKKGHDLYYFKIKPREGAVKDVLKKVEVDSESGQVLKIKDVKTTEKSED